MARPKGTPNRSTSDLRRAIAAVCGEDWDPVVAMAKIAKEGVIPTLKSNPDAEVEEYVNVPVSEKTRQSCLKEVSEYVHAKRRAVEHSNDPDNPLLGQLQVVFEGTDD